MFSKHLKQRPFVPLAGDDTHRDLPLYRDVGHGLRRGHSQKTRSFRLPTVYSNSLADLCVPLTLYVRILTPYVVKAITGILCLWNA